VGARGRVRRRRGTRGALQRGRHRKPDGHGAAAGPAEDAGAQYCVAVVGAPLVQAYRDGWPTTGDGSHVVVATAKDRDRLRWPATLSRRLPQQVDVELSRGWHVTYVVVQLDACAGGVLDTVALVEARVQRLFGRVIPTLRANSQPMDLHPGGARWKGSCEWRVPSTQTTTTTRVNTALARLVATLLVIGGSGAVDLLRVPEPSHRRTAWVESVRATIGPERPLRGWLRAWSSEASAADQRRMRRAGFVERPVRGPCE
jgi:hypothetical protein